MDTASGPSILPTLETIPKKNSKNVEKTRWVVI
jgi:hypothetical protein